MAATKKSRDVSPENMEAFKQRVSDTLALVSDMTAPVAERVAPLLGYALDAWAVVSPYAVKAFHYGFIPFVLFLGMRSEPRPKLLDLLTPM